jgi:HAE1 family hydrophobic/amphiphilic exporter-1
MTAKRHAARTSRYLRSDRNIDSAITDADGDALRAAAPPPTLTAPPSFRKMNPADQPILQITSPPPAST